MKEIVSQLTDDILLRRFQQGEFKAFDMIVERYQKPLFAYLMRFTGDAQIAHDIFQDTFLKVLKSLKNYREQGKFSNWLFGIAHHLAIDNLRREKRQQQIISKSEGKLNHDDDFEHITEPSFLPDRNIERQELKQILNNAINRLSNEQKEVFLLREHTDLTFKEIAELLNRPLNTVLAQMKCALLNLRKILTKEYRGEISHVL